MGVVARLRQSAELSACAQARLVNKLLRLAGLQHRGHSAGRALGAFVAVLRAGEAQQTADEVKAKKEAEDSVAEDQSQGSDEVAGQALVQQHGVDLRQRVLEVLRDTAVPSQGMHVKVIARQLGASLAAVQGAIVVLAEVTFEIFETIPDWYVIT